MTKRDRIVLATVIVIAVMAAGWVGLVSPKRQQASKLSSQVSEAQNQLASAESQLSGARAAQAKYATAYASVVSLGKAVPASQEVPSLIYELTQASSVRNVEFSSITATSSSAPGGSAGATPAASPAGFSQMPFTFVFNGSFFGLERLFQQLSGFTVRSASGDLLVSGRLLTIQSVKLAPLALSEPAGKSVSQKLSGTITATAYTLPTGQSLTGGATSASPVASATAATTPASAGSSSAASRSSSGSSVPSASAPAVVQVPQ